MLYRCLPPSLHISLLVHSSFSSSLVSIISHYHHHHLTIPPLPAPWASLPFATPLKKHWPTRPSYKYISPHDIVKIHLRTLHFLVLANLTPHTHCLLHKTLTLLWSPKNNNLPRSTSGPILEPVEKISNCYNGKSGSMHYQSYNIQGYNFMWEWSLSSANFAQLIKKHVW